MSRVLLAAGGTGGHMFPASAVAELLLAKGHEVHFITDLRGAQYLSQDSSKSVYNLCHLGRRSLKTLPQAVWQMLVLMWGCFFYFLSSRPTKVVGFGGYVTYPVLLMAKLFRVPYFLHEQNSVMGKVNRWFKEGASRVMTSFPHTVYANDNANFVGLPVRREILLAGEASSYQVDKSQFRLLVLGGSQGASIFSSVVPEAIRLMAPEVREKMLIVQQCRPVDLDGVRKSYEGMGIAARVAPFFDRMAEELSQAHLVITRSGASTVAELGIMGRPAIFIPFAAAMDDHQTSNAAYAVDKGAGWMLSEPDLTAARLAQMLHELWNNPSMLEEAAIHMKSLGKSAAAEDMAKQVEA